MHLSWYFAGEISADIIMGTPLSLSIGLPLLSLPKCDGRIGIPYIMRCFVSPRLQACIKVVVAGSKSAHTLPQSVPRLHKPEHKEKINFLPFEAFDETS